MLYFLIFNFLSHVSNLLCNFLMKCIEIMQIVLEISKISAMIYFSVFNFMQIIVFSNLRDFSNATVINCFIKHSPRASPVVCKIFLFTAK